jgi:predicted transcriptional regulator
LLAGNSAILVLKGGKPVQVLSRFDLLDFRRKGE